jgi:UTP--glucose-1-phosphate uridylyltransferase
MSLRIKTVVIPAAGQGTRLLPATKSVPKELMPVYDRPVLQFALDEAVAAGAERIVIVIHPSKDVIRDYTRPADAMIDALRAKGKTGLAAALQDLALPSDVELVFAVQAQPLGLGHAVACCQGHVLPGPVGVILPDDVILGQPCLPEMQSEYDGGHMIAAMEVHPDETSSYGIFRLAGPSRGHSTPASGMVEKPSMGSAPSRLAAVGRYILDASVFRALASTPRGAGGEIQLTDAIAADAERLPLTAFRFSGRRFDCGTHDGLLDAALARQAEVRLASKALHAAE